VNRCQVVRQCGAFHKKIPFEKKLFSTIMRNGFFQGLRIITVLSQEVEGRPRRFGVRGHKNLTLKLGGRDKRVKLRLQMS